MKKAAFLLLAIVSLSILMPAEANAFPYWEESTTRTYTDNNGCTITETVTKGYTAVLGWVSCTMQSIHVFENCDGVTRSYVINMDVANDAGNVAMAFENITSDDADGFVYAADPVFQAYWLSNGNATGINDYTNNGTLTCSEVAACEE